MAWQLKEAGCKLIDYGKEFANGLRLQMKEHVEELAQREGIHIQHVGGAVLK